MAHGVYTASFTTSLSRHYRFVYVICCTTKLFTILHTYMRTTRRSAITDQFSGPGTAIGPVCVSVCPDNNF